MLHFLHLMKNLLALSNYCTVEVISHYRLSNLLTASNNNNNNNNDIRKQVMYSQLLHTTPILLFPTTISSSLFFHLSSLPPLSSSLLSPHTWSSTWLHWDCILHTPSLNLQGQQDRTSGNKVQFVVGIEGGGVTGYQVILKQPFPFFPIIILMYIPSEPCYNVILCVLVSSSHWLGELWTLARISWEYAEDSWTGSNFGGSSLSFWLISTNCWKSTRDLMLKTPFFCQFMSLPHPPWLARTISAPSTIRGTLSGKVTILPGPTVGVMLVMFTTWPLCPGSVSCTTRCDGHPDILMSCHVTASMMCMPAGMSKQVLVYYYIVFLLIKVHHVQLHTRV